LCTFELNDVPYKKQARAFERKKTSLQDYEFDSINGVFIKINFSATRAGDYCWISAFYFWSALCGYLGHKVVLGRARVFFYFSKKDFLYLV